MGNLELLPTTKSTSPAPAFDTTEQSSVHAQDANNPHINNLDRSLPFTKSAE